MSQSLSELEKRIGYKLTDQDLLKTAMTHSSVSLASDHEFNYERLEFLGDRVLGLIIADILYHRYPMENEGDLAKRHAALVQGKTLAGIAQKLQLSEVMILSDSERAVGGAENEHTLADGMEALLGAIYIDGGLEECKRLIQELWDDIIDVMVEPPQDPKTALQEWVQARGLPLPIYEIIEREGPDHAPLFTISVSVEGFEEVVSKASSRRAAEKKAAAALLKIVET